MFTAGRLFRSVALQALRQANLKPIGHFTQRSVSTNPHLDRLNKIKEARNTSNPGTTEHNLKLKLIDRGFDVDLSSLPLGEKDEKIACLHNILINCRLTSEQFKSLMCYSKEELQNIKKLGSVFNSYIELVKTSGDRGKLLKGLAKLYSEVIPPLLRCKSLHCSEKVINFFKKNNLIESLVTSQNDETVENLLKWSDLLMHEGLAEYIPIVFKDKVSGLLKCIEDDNRNNKAKVEQENEEFRRLRLKGAKEFIPHIGYHRKLIEHRDIAEQIAEFTQLIDFDPGSIDEEKFAKIVRAIQIFNENNLWDRVKAVPARVQLDANDKIKCCKDFLYLMQEHPLMIKSAFKLIDSVQADSETTREIYSYFRKFPDPAFAENVLTDCSIVKGVSDKPISYAEFHLIIVGTIENYLKLKKNASSIVNWATCFRDAMMNVSLMPNENPAVHETNKLRR